MKTNGIVTTKTVLDQPFEVSSVALSPDGNHLAVTGILTRDVVIWDLHRKKIIRTLKKFASGGDMHLLAYSPDGHYLAAGSRVHHKDGDPSVDIWDAATGEEISVIRNHAGAQSLAFSPDSQLVAVGYSFPGLQENHMNIGLYDSATGKLTKELMEGPLGLVNHSLAFGSMQGYLAEGGFISKKPDHPGIIRLWDTQTGKIVKTIQAFSDGHVVSLAYSPDGKFIACGTNTGVENGYRDPVTTAWVTKKNEEPVRIFDTETAKNVFSLAGHVATVQALSYSGNGKYLFSGSYDKTVRIWNTNRYELIEVLNHSYLITDLAANKEGTLLAVGGSNVVTLWALDFDRQRAP